MPNSVLPPAFAGARPPSFADPKEERRHRQERLAASFRLFSKFGFEEGVAGHITARDPELADHFWVNPLAVPFAHIRVSDLLLVDAQGEIVQGEGRLNRAAFVIHSQIHQARPDVVAAAHSHSVHGKALSCLEQLLEPLTQDACAFYQDHAVFDDYSGVVLDLVEGRRIASTLGTGKAAILRNHGLLTVGTSIDAAVWWFIAMERACQVQLLAKAAGTTRSIGHESAALTHQQIGGDAAGWLCFQPLYQRILREQPDFLE